VPSSFCANRTICKDIRQNPQLEAMKHHYKSFHNGTKVINAIGFFNIYYFISVNARMLGMTM
jgi:hypothetical protein